MASGLKKFEERCGEGDCCAMRGAVVDSASAGGGQTAQALSSGQRKGGFAQALAAGQGSAAWRGALLL